MERGQERLRHCHITDSFRGPACHAAGVPISQESPKQKTRPGRKTGAWTVRPLCPGGQCTHTHEHTNASYVARFSTQMFSVANSHKMTFPIVLSLMLLSFLTNYSKLFTFLIHEVIPLRGRDRQPVITNTCSSQRSPPTALRNPRGCPSQRILAAVPVQKSLHQLNTTAAPTALSPPPATKSCAHSKG